MEKLFINKKQWDELPELQLFNDNSIKFKILQTDTNIIKVLEPIGTTTNDILLVEIVDTVSYMGDE